MASITSKGPLSGVKCRPCSAICTGPCVEKIMKELDQKWSWTEWKNGSIELCDASNEWEKGWEWIFDGVAGKEAAKERKRIKDLDATRCVREFEVMKGRTDRWEAPALWKICSKRFGTTPNTRTR